MPQRFSGDAALRPNINMQSSTIWRPALLWILSCALLFACSSVQRLPPNNASVSLPNLSFGNAGGVVAVGGVDYKRRERSRPGIRLVVGPATGGEKLPAALRTMIVDAALSSLKFNDVQLIVPESADEIGSFPDARSLAFMAARDADALVTVAIETFDADRGGAEILLRDPVDGSQLGKRRLLFSIDQTKLDPARQLDYYVNRNGVRALADRSVPAPRFELPGKTAMRALVERTITGTLSVLATAPGAVVELQSASGKRPIGRAPLVNLRVPEGKALVRVRRKGFPVFVAEVIIRAGRESRVQAVWPGDTKIASLSVLSAPPGLRLALDGVIRGETPAFLTDVRAGTYGLEVARSMSGGTFSIEGDARVQLGDGENESLAFFVKYDADLGANLLQSGLWQVATEGKRTVALTSSGGLGIKGQGNQTTWSGIASLPFALLDTRIAVDAIQTPEGNAGFLLLGTNESVLLELADGQWSAVHFRGSEPAAPPVRFRALREGNIHQVQFRYLRQTGQLQLSLDGSELLRVKWNPGPHVRLALLARGKSLDGRPLATKLKIRGGRAVGEE